MHRCTKKSHKPKDLSEASHSQIEWTVPVMTVAGSLIAQLRNWRLLHQSMGGLNKFGVHNPSLYPAGRLFAHGLHVNLYAN